MSIKLAIVGMDAIAGSCIGLDAIVNSSYEGKPHFTQPAAGVPGTYLSSLEVDAFELKIPPKDFSRFTPAELLLLTVLHRAVGQGKDGLTRLGVIQPAGANSAAAETIDKARVGHRRRGGTIAVQTQPQTASPTATKLAQLWRCQTTTLTLEPNADFVLSAIDRAQLMLTAGEVDAVAIAVSHQASLIPPAVGKTAFSYEAQAQENYPGEGAAAIVLKSYEKAIQAGDRIYAVIEATSHCQPAFVTAEAVAARVRQGLQQVGVAPAAVGYLELVASGNASIDEIELKGLTQVYRGDPGSELCCAVGSIKANLGETGAVADLLGMIHAALCLYHRYLPPVPNWQAPRHPALWQASPFYVPTEARPWLSAGPQLQRRAAVNSRHGHLLLAEAHHPQQPGDQTRPVCLFAIAAADQPTLLSQLDQLEQRLSETDSLGALARETSLAASPEVPYALALVGAQKEKLLKEIERARIGIQRAFSQGKDWKSPAGSYFTARPQGQQGSVAFVYPGAFNTYLDMGRTLFHRFPQLFERVDRLISNPLAFFQVQQLYPKSQHKLSKRELEAREAQLGELPLALLETGTGFSVLFTEIIQKIFQVQPQAAFGYSMGESTMMYALDVWSNADYGSEFVHQSRLFQSQLGGAQEVIQAHWPDTGKLRWSSYVLLTSPEQVRACLAQEPRVYLTHINTPQEVVIGGDAEGCDRVIAALQCESFRSPANLVLHCEAMASAYPELFALNHLQPLNPSPIRFYTSATYQPLPLDQDAVAHQLATGICQPLDFPQLVNQVYADGARVFIELGAGGTCARWISQNLAQRDHAVMGINRRGTDDYTAIVKALAQLVSHRVSLDLSPLYGAAAGSRPSLPQRVGLRSGITPTEKSEPSVKTEILNAAEVLELTQDRVSRLFGPDYERVDGYLRRVRLPSPPFHFVSRVTALSGDRGDYTTGVIETEYDIPPDAWYSVDGQIPIGICAEAGHGLLLLLSYLGSDFESRGQRSFRLLDLNSEFKAVQPKALKTLRYRVKITAHVQTTRSLLVFFEGECWAGDRLWMQLSGGCAGLFSDEELAKGQGIVAKPVTISDKKPFIPLLSSPKTQLDTPDLVQLSRGNLSVLGPDYQADNPSLRLPPPALMMVDQVTQIEPTGGGAGLGQILGSKTVTPEDWYFQCHFKNDPTMPGSLMVEGGSQLLQVYLLWLGLHRRVQKARFQPLPGCKMAFQFRGQVTPATGTLRYQLDVTEIGLEPRPYAIANIQVIWSEKIIATIDHLGLQLDGTAAAEAPTKELAFDDESLRTLAMGRVADCLGPDFAVFDQRRCARIPNRDFQLVSRVLQVPTERRLVPGAKIVTEYDVPVDAWFYRENSYPHLPYCAHIEIAGQPCIFLGLYLGTPLQSLSEDLYFRNIDGQATVLKEIDLRGKTITDEVELTSVNVLAGTILQSFSYQLSCEGEPFYRGTMVFGYFSDQVLAHQSGLDGGKLKPTWLESAPAGKSLNLRNQTVRKRFYQPQVNRPHARLASGYFDLLDRAAVVAAGGQHQQGYVYAEKTISPSSWYFPFHFYQDPVMPGALGVETILQAMQLYALHQGLDQGFTSPRFAQALNHPIIWKYRGQITPDNQKLYLEVHISEIRREAERITIIGDASLWKETMRIYAIQAIALCIQEA
ncbi:PfaB family protein [Vasconcelosia minhoensis]|nr:PfaB family protein [Romeria gracilis]